MIMITLNKIKAHNPCTSGWRTILKAHNKTDADDVPFPLADTLTSNGLSDALWALRCLPEHNSLWRKYAVWCARQVQHLMTDPRSITALDVALQHSEGNASDDELRNASDAADAARADAAAAAADADAAAAYDARAAAYAARAAADSARAAADSAYASYAARAASYAARAAADSAYVAAAAAAADADAAYAAAYAAAAEKQATTLQQILTLSVWTDELPENLK